MLDIHGSLLCSDLGGVTRTSVANGLCGEQRAYRRDVRHMDDKSRRYLCGSWSVLVFRGQSRWRNPIRRDLQFLLAGRAPDGVYEPSARPTARIRLMFGIRAP